MVYKRCCFAFHFYEDCAAFVRRMQGNLAKNGVQTCDDCFSDVTGMKINLQMLSSHYLEEDNGNRRYEPNN